MVLNLGSGNRPIDGAVNIDRNRNLPLVVVCYDIGKMPWPFKDSVFDEVVAHHILEHLPDLISAMNEIHRVSKNGALVHIEVPHYTNPQFYDDPTHVRPFSEYTIPWMTNPDNATVGGLTGRFLLQDNVILGQFWNRKKPTVIVGEIRIVK